MRSILKADVFKPAINVYGICIPSNGTVTKSGGAVMGAGVAKQAKLHCQGIEKAMALHLKDGGNHVHWLGTWPLPRQSRDGSLGCDIHVFNFPVKHHWAQKADIALIRQSCEELGHWLHGITGTGWSVWLPAPGCGNGGLHWSDVGPAIDGLLPETVVIINRFA